MRPFSLNIHGRLIEYTQPTVMGILNVTSDSFYEASRAIDQNAVETLAKKMVKEGADFIDVGAYSTRPGCSDVSIQQEIDHLAIGIHAVRKISPDIVISVDTFRSEVATVAIEQMGANIINDISGGNIDPNMYDTVAKLQVPYVLMHSRGDINTMHTKEEYEDLVPEIIHDLVEKVAKLNLLGVNDIIIDPGFGFSKTLEQNYLLLQHLGIFDMLQLPIMVGVSRKSMITKLLNMSADQAAHGTTAINTIALQRGASILRVHDVEAARQAIEIYSALNQNNKKFSR